MISLWRDSVIALVAVFVLSGLGTQFAIRAGWDGDAAAWFSAFATSLAIVAAVAVVRLQLLAQARAERARRADLAQVAYDLAGEALALVTDRLNVALSPSQPQSVFELREHRTTETILAMRELEPHTLPPTILQPFVQVRSRVHAINRRISEVYEKRARDRNYDQHGKLGGAVTVHPLACAAFTELGEVVDKELVGKSLPRRTIPVPNSVTNYEADRSTTSSRARPRPRLSRRTS